MTPWVRLVEKISGFAQVADDWSEQWDFLNAHGKVSPETLRNLIDLVIDSEQFAPDIVLLRLDDESYDLESLHELATDAASTILQKNWHLQIPKTALLRAAKVPQDEHHLLFFNRDTFTKWSKTIDPFQLDELVLDRPTTILVAGLNTNFGGPWLRIGPPQIVSNKKPDVDSFPSLPNSREIHKLIHVIDPGIPRLNPSAFVLTYGDRNTKEARPFLLAACKILSACLANDLYLKEGKSWVVIRGIRRMEWPLCSDGDLAIDTSFQDELIEAVQWIYENSADTRHALFADRLSIDTAGDGSFLAGLRSYLTPALRQAKERFVFVIRDRKDEYHKELREVLKDVRAQADLYASKVRQLVETLLRDTLSILVVLGIGLIARTPPGQLEAITVSAQVQLFFKALAIYFVISILLQTMSHVRDIWLAWNESNVWREKMRNYMSDSELEETFQIPLGKRRVTFFVAIFTDVILYISLAIAAWRFEDLVGYLATTLH
ncbi:MAG: hypothetical protein JAZ11_02770 [Candidatus Thiodiazotropha lotti]|nr:hypothetical protein [Candidatus Thiodiazotropha lotti]